MEDITSTTTPLKELAAPSRHDYEMMASDMRKMRGIHKRFIEAQRQQADILIYLYKHHSLSAVQLRSQFRLNKITGYRQAGALIKAGLIKWKGSHKRGAYVITDEGKKFLEEKLADKTQPASL